jgi:hypothetical protein
MERKDGMNTSNEDAEVSDIGIKQSNDGLLWIGGSYKEIECNDYQNCAEEKRTRCFVHEAAWRGISRKVAHVPKWAIPGKTKIFLVHRGGFKALYKGKIFGYFILSRVEKLSQLNCPASSPDIDKVFNWSNPSDRGKLTITTYDSSSGQKLRGVSIRASGGTQPSEFIADEIQEKSSLKLPSGQYSLHASLGEYGVATLDGVVVLKGKRRNLDLYLHPQPAKKSVKTKKCDNGEVIVTHIRENDKWVRTGNKFPESSSPSVECEEGDIKWMLCENGTLIPDKFCKKGKWKSTGASCPMPDSPHKNDSVNIVNITDEFLSEHRSCSLRLCPQAVYIVDSLAAEIHDMFSSEINDLRKRYQSAQTEQEREESVIQGRKKHEEVIKSVLSGRQSSVLIDSRLTYMADLRGDLVVFKKPVDFIKHPTASFRSLEHIDGENLLAQITNGETRPTIRIIKAHSSRKNGSLTRSEIEVLLASRLQLSLVTTLHFLNYLSLLAKTELGEKGIFKIPGIGSLKKVQYKSQTSRPLNRKKIVNCLLTYFNKSLSKTAGRTPHVNISAINKLLNELSHIFVEQSQNGILRLPHLGTFRFKKGYVTSFTKAQALAVEEKLVFEPV